MRFQPANISLINRRHYLPRLLLTLSSFEKKRPAHLDRSLHIKGSVGGNSPGTYRHRAVRPLWARMNEGQRGLLFLRQANGIGSRVPKDSRNAWIRLHHGKERIDFGPCAPGLNVRALPSNPFACDGRSARYSVTKSQPAYSQS
jgi:hypothetical protein